MPVAFRSASSVKWGFGGNTGVANVNVPVPAGVQAGDIMVATIAISTTMGISFPGWTLLVQDQVNGGSSNGTFATYWRRATASEPATYNATVDSGFRTGAVVVVAYSGALATGTPITVTNANNGQVTGQAITTPALTVPDDGLLLLLYGVSWLSEDFSMFAAPAGTTSRSYLHHVCVLRLCEVAAAAGTTPTYTSTTPQNVNGYAGTGRSMFLAPEPVGGPRMMV